jgi:hypothetical protein
MSIYDMQHLSQRCEDGEPEVCGHGNFAFRCFECKVDREMIMAFSHELFCYTLNRPVTIPGHARIGNGLYSRTRRRS